MNMRCLMGRLRPRSAPHERDRVTRAGRGKVATEYHRHSAG